LFAAILTATTSISSSALQSGNFKYSIINNEAQIDGYTGGGSAVTIPETIDGYRSPASVYTLLKTPGSAVSYCRRG
jgi:hypothetical protein